MVLTTTPAMSSTACGFMQTVAAVFMCVAASRLREVADKELNANKRAVLEKLSFGSLLKIRPFSVPLELIDWVVMRIDTKHSLFSRKKKTIVH